MTHSVFKLLVGGGGGGGGGGGAFHRGQNPKQAKIADGINIIFILLKVTCKITLITVIR